ncbi:MAG TPA: alkaline phosphatase family protein, partial [Candidatus Dormibacteraeota bacterium]|nr:alkaline phosphatase family protein [Candidatus Dormibacteraeota bacterium]
MAPTRAGILGLACVVGLSTGLLGTASAASAHDRGRPAAQHVLLLSVDGLHQSDLAWFVAHHPRSALAGLVKRGVEFTNAQTPVPSDSFPGLVGQVTGGDPSSTGIYYDDTFNHALLPAGTTSCGGVAPGVEVTYFEQADLNQRSLDAGQGLAGLP